VTQPGLIDAPLTHPLTIDFNNRNIFTVTFLKLGVVIDVDFIPRP